MTVLSRVAAAVATSIILVASSNGQEDAGALAIERGKASYRAGRYLEAVNDFRIARFSSLADPVLYLEVLARLALAEDAAAQGAARDTTLDRFRDTERQYKAFRLESLDPELRDKFVALFVKRFGREQAMAIPTLAAALAAPGVPAAGRGTPTAAAARPRAAPPAPTATATIAVIVPSTLTPTPRPSPSPPPTPRRRLPRR